MRRFIFFLSALCYALGFVLTSPKETPGLYPVLGIFAGTLILWLFVAIDWPSILALCLLCLVPTLSTKDVLLSSFGSPTFAFLLFAFLCTYALSKTRLLRRIALLFLRSSLAQKGSLGLALSFFSAVLLLGLFLSPTVLFLLFFPMFEEIVTVLGHKEGDAYPCALLCGLVFVTGISSGMTPFSHVFPIIALDFYAQTTGEAIGVSSFLTYALPLGLLTILFMMVLLLPALRQGHEVKSLSFETLPPMDRREKWGLFIYLLVLFLWVVPDLFSSLPFAAFLKARGSAFPPLLGTVLLCILSVEGRPLLVISEGLAKGVPWSALSMALGTLSLGSALTQKGVGITDAVSSFFSHVLTGHHPLLLLFLILLWTMVETNLSSNIVTVSVVSALAIPLALSTELLDATLVAIFVGAISSYAFAFPPAMPCVALAISSGWTKGSSIALRGLVLGFGSILFAILLTVMF